MPIESIGEITAVQQIADMTFRVVAQCPDIAKTAIPGQFAMLGFESPLFDPFLRRPMSFANSEFGRVEFIIRVVGWGSALLADLKPGERIPILGPLGNGFPEPIDKAILVAGGTGIAPLAFAAGRWKKTVIIYGERTQDNICTLHNGICEKIIATEDGSVGQQGLATDFLENELKKGIARVYTCGPIPMMRHVAEIASEYGTECFVSMEAKMACGIGACAGCVIETKTGYKKVCSEGPVFEASEIIWEALDD
jgi:dihydroorotate dehydrogenase electron transfer subunit